jgi:hypothetical protein
LGDYNAGEVSGLLLPTTHYALFQGRIATRIKSILHGAERAIIYKRWRKVPLALKSIFHGAERAIIYKRWRKVPLAPATGLSVVPLSLHSLRERFAPLQSLARLRRF